MKTGAIADRLAVCSWSLQPKNGEQLIEWILAIGVPRVQLELDPFHENGKAWTNFKSRCDEKGISIASGMFRTVGEDYTTMESIRLTGGVVPDATWQQNWRNIQGVADMAQRMGIRLVTFHAGFLPEDEKDPEFGKLYDRICRIADLFAVKGIDLGFETGQETAETLREFLVKLNRPTVGVNFDPANMILYDKGDPVAALRALGPWLKQCHLKDANRTRKPGTWGDEVVVGTGEVDWKSFFRALQELNFPGYLAIEREAGLQRLEDIRAAKQFVSTLKV
jgi:L-ribulose-5-phosphate 3-epimerase